MPPTLEYVRPRFEETQQMHYRKRWHVFFVVMALLGFALTLFLFMVTHRSMTMIAGGLITVAGCGGAILGYVIFPTLRTRVDGEGVHVSLGPLPWKTFPAGEIVSARACTYDAMREFGGWGTRVRVMNNADCYTLQGDRGVRISLHNGREVLIGSEKAEALQASISEIITSMLPAGDEQAAVTRPE